MSDFETLVARRLADRFYRPDRWALVRQVPDSTGGPRSRVADLVAVSLWPSDGLELHLIEVKASRSDLLRELRDPGKAAAVGAYCHRRYLVAPDVVRPEDDLTGWGLYVVAPDGQAERVYGAPLRNPLPPSPTFVAALVRAALGSRGRRASSVD